MSEAFAVVERWPVAGSIVLSEVIVTDVVPEGGVIWNNAVWPMKVALELSSAISAFAMMASVAVPFWIALTLKYGDTIGPSGVPDVPGVKTAASAG